MKKISFPLKALVSVTAFVVICGGLYFASNNVNGRYSQEKLENIENAVRRAAVSCYAIEGIYPPDVAYMKEHYGLGVDEEKYTVMYIVYGSNLMPNIDVLPILKR